MTDNNNHINMLNRVVISVFASSKSKPLFILGGTLLKYIGWQICRDDILWLGHYLQSTGISRTLSKKFTREVIEGAKNSINNPYNDPNVLIPEDDSELFTTIGKCKMSINGTDGDAHIHLVDKYIFYATCENAMTHFDDCGCPDDNRQWATLDRSLIVTTLIKQKNPIDTKFYLALGDYCDDSYIHITIDEYGMCVYLHISDRFWVGKGKEFMTFGDFDWKE